MNIREGGGAYIVAGRISANGPALTAAAALMIDYVLTVAVSVAAGIAAITSAVPAFFPHREALGLAGHRLRIVVMNLRGVRESGRFFAVPTYIVHRGHACTVLVGSAQILFGHAGHVSRPPADVASRGTASLFFSSFAPSPPAVRP